MSQESLIEVAVDSNISGVFTYRCSAPVRVGMRALVPFGRQNRKKVGVVVGVDGKENDFDLKYISEIIDEFPVFSPKMMSLARWLSEYYLYPLGAVLKVMLPAASRLKTKCFWSLTEKGLEAWNNQNGLIRAVFKRRSDLLNVSFQKNIKSVPQRAFPKGVKNLERYLVNGGYIIRLERSSLDKEVQKELTDEVCVQASSKKTLNAEQDQAYRKIFELGILNQPKRPFLLWGVTGSGKTEVYLQLIDSLFNEDIGGQVLVMVPEISLTPQMTMIFESRFPNLVSVVHSAMDSDQRWQRLESIRNGKRKILIGPRSAVFGPFRNLKLIIVDEEHDSSYKQSSGFQYNGRDVAVLRGKIEDAAVVLGSATPSIESYSNSIEGKYELIRINVRAHGSKLPPVEVVEYSPNRRRGQCINGAMEECEVPIHPEILEKLKNTIEKGQQAMVIVNRRGFAYFLMSRKENCPVACPNCSVSLTVHKRKSSLKCHYCDYSESLSKYLGTNEEYVVVGYGSEQVEAFLMRELGGAKIVRIDSDSVSEKGTLETLLTEFRQGSIDVLVGTQMLAKGHDFPNVTLICLLEVDQMLNLPDFRAGERAFQLMVQASGRAGRSNLDSAVLLQTRKPRDEIIKSAVNHDFESFAKREIEFRRDHHFPPFSKMVHFEFSAKKVEVLDSFLNQVAMAIGKVYKEKPDLRRKVAVLGPTVPPIEMVRGRIRRSIILSSQEQTLLWKLASYIKKICSRLPSDIRMKLDVDPQSIL